MGAASRRLLGAFLQLLAAAYKMQRMRSWIVALVLLAGCAAQTPQPSAEATPQQKARSDVAAAFMTGTAPDILSKQVALGPELQARLALPPGTPGAKVYDALLGLMQGATPKVGDATPEEAGRFPQLTAPVLTLSAGELKLLLHYDLQAGAVDFVEQLNAPPVAAAAPVPDAARPQPVSESSETIYSVVEPKTPPKGKAKRKVQPRSKPKPQTKSAMVQASLPPPVEPPLRPNGPCVIKPVMSDQDLVNCGATPPRYQPHGS
jgi:hypothetical protein